MGVVLLFIGIGFASLGVIMLIVYLIAGKFAGNRLRKKLMEEY